MKGGSNLLPVPVLHAGALLVQVEAVVVTLHHGPVHPELDLLGHRRYLGSLEGVH